MTVINGIDYRAANGPDTSHYQEIVDEDAIPDWLLWTSKLGEGKTYRDSTFTSFHKVMLKKKIRYTGGYFWLRPDSSAEAQFNNLVSCLHLAGVADRGDLIDGFMIQHDWERTNSNGVPLLPYSFPSLAMVNEFNDRVYEKYGDRLIVYAADWVDHFITWRRSVKGSQVPLWYADYSYINGPKEARLYNADVLQWTSSYLHRAVRSKSIFSRGFDMNAVLNPATLERICGYKPAPVPVIGRPESPIVIRPTYPEVIPTLEEMDDLMRVRIEIENRGAIFYADAPLDARGEPDVMSVVWSGSGEDSKAQTFMFGRDLNPRLMRRTYSAEVCRNWFVLLGKENLPLMQDGQHPKGVWSVEDFAQVV